MLNSVTNSFIMVSLVINDKISFRNFSALTHAVHTGHTDVAEFLLEYGADPNLIENEKVKFIFTNLYL